MSSITGKVAVVTGGGRGIGRAIAHELAKLGTKVAVLARSSNEINTVAVELRELGAEALAISLDVTDLDAINKTVATITDKLGTIEILVNNAGVVKPIGEYTKVDVKAWKFPIEVNLFGTHYLTHAVLPTMLENGYGRIVNISSSAGRRTGAPWLGAYSVSKAAIDMYTRNLAQEIDGSGVTINAVDPGPVDTEMVKDIRSKGEDGGVVAQRLDQMTEQGKLIPPQTTGELTAGLILSNKQGEIVPVMNEEKTLRAYLEAAQG